MNERLLLSYVPRRGKRRLIWWPAVLWLVISTAIWRTTDWWAYVDEGGGTKPWPKFEWPLSVQVGASSILGLVITGALVGVLWLTRRSWNRSAYRRRMSPD